MFSLNEKFLWLCDLVKIGGTGWTNGATDRLGATLDVAPEEGLHNKGRRSSPHFAEGAMHQSSPSNN